MMPVKPPSDAIRFRMSLFVVWVFRVAIACALGYGALCVFLLLTDHRVGSTVFAIVGILAVGLAIFYCWGAARRALNQIAVNDTGIWRIPPKGDPLFIPWREIGSVKADDTMQRLILADQSSSRVIWLEYQIENFSDLRDYVVQHTNPSTRHAPAGQNVFHRTWINKVIVLIASSTWIALGFLLLQTNWRFSGSMFAVAALVLATIIGDPLSLTVGVDQLVINYPGWKREIFFRNIKSVSLSDESNRGNVWAALIVTPMQGRPIKLYRFREGSLAMQETVQEKLDAFSKGQG